MSNEQRQLVRTLDTRLLPFLALLYLTSFLDRVNIGNAKVAHLDSDLNLSPNEYNLALSVFFIGYILFELPSNMVMKAWKASRWMSLLMFIWGSITMCMALVRNAAGLIAARFFLGLSEGGLFPGILLYLASYYTRTEQAVRIAFFFGAATVAGAFGGVLSYYITQLDGLHGIRGWQWLFIIEGAATVAIAIVCFFYLPDTPCSAWFLTPQQRRLVVDRLVDPNLDDSSNVRSGHVHAPDLVSVFTDWKTLLHCIIAITSSIAFYSISLFLPSIVRGLGYTGATAQLMSSPPYVVAFPMLLATAWHSDRKHERGLHIATALFAASVGYVALSLITNNTARFAILVFTAAAIFSHIPPLLSWVSNNFCDNRRRAVALAVVTSANNVGGLCAGWVYHESDGPHYHRGHATCAALTFIAGSFVLFLRIMLSRENRRRDCLVDVEKHQWLRTLDSSRAEIGDRHPDFRYML